MKNTFTNKLTISVLLASLAFLSLSASAGQDENLRYINQQFHKLQQQAKATEAATQEAAAIKAEECKKQMEQGKNTSGT